MYKTLNAPNNEKCGMYRNNFVKKQSQHLKPG